MKQAVVDENNTVVNVIVADDEYEHPQHELRNAEGVRVQPGDYYLPDSDTFERPRIQIDGDDSIVNDGEDTATVEVSIVAREDAAVSLQIGDFEDEVTLGPDETHTEDMTTTTSDEQIVIVGEADGLVAGSHTIEVEKA